MAGSKRTKEAKPDKYYGLDVKSNPGMNYDYRHNNQG
jgi:hypothetical protein